MINKLRKPNWVFIPYIGWIHLTIRASNHHKKQSEYLKKAGGDFSEEIEVVETPRTTTGNEIRNFIENEDFLAFKKLVPQGVSSFYNSLLSSINGKGIKESEEIIESEILDLENEALKENIEK